MRLLVVVVLSGIFLSVTNAMRLSSHYSMRDVERAIAAGRPMPWLVVTKSLQRIIFKVNEVARFHTAVAQLYSMTRTRSLVAGARWQIDGRKFELRNQVQSCPVLARKYYAGVCM